MVIRRRVTARAGTEHRDMLHPKLCQICCAMNLCQICCVMDTTEAAFTHQHYSSSTTAPAFSFPSRCSLPRSALVICTKCTQPASLPARKCQQAFDLEIHTAQQQHHSQQHHSQRHTAAPLTAAPHTAPHTQEVRSIT